MRDSRDEALRTEYLRRAKVVAEAFERSNAMERDFLDKKVLNAEANEALEDASIKRAQFGEWLLQVSDQLFAASATAPLPANARAVAEKRVVEAAKGWLERYADEVRDPSEEAPCKNLVAAVDAVLALDDASLPADAVQPATIGVCRQCGYTIVTQDAPLPATQRSELVLDHEIGERLDELSKRLMATTEFHQDAHTVLEAGILLMRALQELVGHEAKLDAIAAVLGHPKGAWKIAGCDVLAHYVQALQDNYIALRDAPLSEKQAVAEKVEDLVRGLAAEQAFVDRWWQKPLADILSALLDGTTLPQQTEGIARYLGDKQPENTSPWLLSEKQAMPGQSTVGADAQDAVIATAPSPDGNDSREP